MKQVLLLDPGVSTLNLGDEIISQACEAGLSHAIDDAYVVRVSSHLPVSKYLSYGGHWDETFVCGSNLLRGKMNSRFRQWDVTPWTMRWISDAVLMGVGWWQYGDEPTAYTKWLYRRLLHADLLHSVRDEMTARYMRSMGFTNVLNTACPTMWSLTDDHCAAIPAVQGERVVSTLTDYAKDPVKDRELLMTLGERYGQVHVWLQGLGDADYLHSLEMPPGLVEVVPPRLSAYDALLDREGTDYVGTRLHGGIRALQKGRRAVIVGVDNRAAEKHRDFNLPYISRDDLSGVRSVLESAGPLKLRLPFEAIERWKAQFVGTPSAHA